MTYWLGVIVVTAIYMIAIIGVSVLSGFTGLFSLGHAAFMAIGAYTSAIVVNTFQVPIVVGLAAGTLLATLIGLFIGAPAYQRRLFYSRNYGDRRGGLPTCAISYSDYGWAVWVFGFSLFSRS